MGNFVYELWVSRPWAGMRCLMARTPFLVDSQPTRVPNVPKRIGLKERRRRMCLREGVR